MPFFDQITPELIYTSVAYLSPAAFTIGLIAGWKNINSRCFIGLLFMLELIDTLLIDIVWEWSYNYYVWVFLYGTLYIYVIIFRRVIAKTLSPFSNFFRGVYNNYHFTKYEGLLLLVYSICLTASFIALVEMKLYEYSIIKSWAFTKYALGCVLIPATIIEGVLILKVALKKPVVSMNNVSIVSEINKRNNITQSKDK
ncbi:hypothetical protein L1077_10400 [Pseudoalteromonas luteoviolacea]|uniref:hypothetical protein n=1 Tax=Pseudoalteromonas luteoviolacea TaxID=43657 RepID=UPI001F2420D3|nr:hypothetical protein [Pseudoalteromonas luteoviolacea]MCF6439843.1 hypothetical protein [Pseudoalteromonas luteoviolacea]